MTRFKMFQIVIVNVRGVNKVGLIIGRSIKHKKRVFDIRLENGSEFPYVRVDDTMDSMYIDSALSKSIGPLINTNLNVLNQGNIRNPKPIERLDAA